MVRLIGPLLPALAVVAIAGPALSGSAFASPSVVPNGIGTGLEPGSTRTSPKEVLFDGPEPASLTYGFRGNTATDIRVRVISASSGKVVRSWVERSREPRTRYTRIWNGTDERGRSVASGRYRFRFGPAGSGIRWPAGSFVIRDHIYPVDGPHSARGAIGEFGAPRSGGRTHEGFDVLADCGTPLVAARGGEVRKARFDPVLFGWFVLIDGRKTKRDYFYSHLRDKPKVAKGERVHTGQRIGRVGQTGNARSTPCHLHFELRGPRGPMDPKLPLQRWDRWS